MYASPWFKVDVPQAPTFQDSIYRRRHISGVDIFTLHLRFDAHRQSYDDAMPATA